MYENSPWSLIQPKGSQLPGLRIRVETQPNPETDPTPEKMPDPDPTKIHLQGSNLMKKPVYII